MKTALLFALSLIATPALAQDEDSGGGRRGKDEVVREIERGLFIKAGAGTMQYLATYRGFLTPVVAANLSVGQDFIDQEKYSLAWEATFNQALHNGPKLDQILGSPPVQGDIHTFAGIATIEASVYLTRRFGLGLRAGGGIMMAPILMEITAYTNEIEPQFGGPASVHSGPLPLAGGGPTIEYYTKLSHFSLGADIDALYVIGLDLGISGIGYLKYTF